MRRRLLISVLAPVALLGTTGAGSDSMITGVVPSVVVTPEKAAVGDGVRVTLTGWPTGVVEVGVCGDGAARGSADCAVTTARAVAIPAKATVPPSTVLRLAAPPVACPCVVRAVHRDAGLVATVGLDLTGVPATVKPAPSAAAAATRTLRVDEATLGPAVSGAAAWREWLGLRAGRTLRVTVTNTGTTPLTDPVWSLAVGRETGGGTVVPTPALGTMGPGESEHVAVPVTLDGPVFGSYRVSGGFDGLDAPAQLVATTAAWPWGVPAVVGLAAIALGLVGRVQSRRARRRRASEVPRNSTTAAMQAPTKSRA